MAAILDFFRSKLHGIVVKLLKLSPFVFILPQKVQLHMYIIILVNLL